VELTPLLHNHQFKRFSLYVLQDVLPPDVPIISVSKGLEMGTGKMMSEVIPDALGRRQPAAFLSGPSFAKEMMDLRPTGVVAASKVIPIVTSQGSSVEVNQNVELG
jgi:glycerol-3-phosphate dehydrogenase (NAD+)